MHDNDTRLLVGYALAVLYYNRSCTPYEYVLRAKKVNCIHLHFRFSY